MNHGGGKSGGASAKNNDNNSVFNVHENETIYEYSHDNEPLFNFSYNNNSHLLDQNEFLFNTMLPYQAPPPIMEEEEEAPKQQDPSTAEKGKKKAVARRTGKKDRHSKIFTAHGPRDRRMRLSLQIARKFFDLQDMLGFDKASKTIEWLFNKSKSAIKDLSDKTLIIPSSPLQDNNDNNNNNNDNDTYMNNNDDDDGSNGERLRDDKDKKQMVEGNGGPRTKESRAKAREWARKRTKEKLMKKKDGNNDNNNHHNKGMEQNPNIRVNDNDNQMMMQQQPLEDQMASVGIIERFLASSSSSMTDFQLDYDNNRGFGPGTIEQMMRYNDDLGFEGVPGNYADYGGSNNYGVVLNRDYNQGI